MPDDRDVEFISTLFSLYSLSLVFLFIQQLLNSNLHHQWAPCVNRKGVAWSCVLDQHRHVGHYSRDFEKKRRILWNQELYTVAFLITFGHAIRYNEMANQNTWCWNILFDVVRAKDKIKEENLTVGERETEKKKRCHRIRVHWSGQLGKHARPHPVAINCSLKV